MTSTATAAMRTFLFESLPQHAGMVADKHKVNAAQAAAMGMLSPTTGLSVMESLLTQVAKVGSSASACGVVGAAQPQYWQLLLKAAKQQPPLFEAIVDLSNQQQVRVRTKAMRQVVSGTA